MTVQLSLPKDVELRLLEEVQAGRHASLEEAILEKLSRSEDADVMAMTKLDSDRLRAELNDAWSNRSDAVDGESVFSRINAKSSARKSENK